MSGHSVSPSPASPNDAPALGPKSRRWKKLLVTLLIMSLVGSLTLVLVSYHFWQNRANYISQTLKHFLPDLDPGLGTLDLSATDLKLTDLVFRDPETKQPFASLRSATLSPYWETIRYQSIGHLQLDGLHLTTTVARLPTLLAPFITTSSANSSLTPSTTAKRAFSIAGLDLTDLQIHLIGDDTIPTIRFTLDHQFETLHISAEGVPSLASTRFTLRDLQITTADGSHLEIPQAHLQASFDAATGMLTVQDFQLPTLDLSILPALTTVLETFFSGENSESSALPSWFNGVAVQLAAFDSLHLAAREGLPANLGLPAIAAETQLTYRVENLRWTNESGLTQAGSHALKLTDTSLTPLNAAEGYLILPSLIIDLRQNSKSQQWQIETLAAEGKPELNWTQALEDALLGPAKDSAVDEAPNPELSAAPTRPLSFLINKLNLTDLALQLHVTRLIALPLIGKVTLHGQDIQFADSKIRSSKPQHLLFTDIETLIPGSRTSSPTLIDSIEVRLQPDALFATGLIDRLHIIHPRLSYNLDFNALAEGTPPPVPLTPPAPFSLPPPLDRLHFQHLAVTEGEVKISGRWGAAFEAETTFSLTTEALPDGSSAAATGSSRHTLNIAATRLLATGSTPLPVAQVGQFQATAQLPQLLTERHVERLSLDGGQVEFGEALIAILDRGKTRTPTKVLAPLPLVPPDQETATAPALPIRIPFAPPKKWTAGEVSVNDLSITLQKIAPGLPPLTFSVQFQAENTPLEPEGLVENVDAQRIELTSLTIPAPYGSLRPVARLDTIFIHFTLDGLLRQRIARVEILNPTLYVGEPLFWYVDYYRKFAAGETNPDMGRMALASAANDVALNAVSQILSTAPVPAKSWAIDELAVHSGKIILAPKGVPLPGFRQPFPFSFSTRLDSGKLDAVFDIPSDNYPLPDLDLEFIGMKGQVRFNLPLRNVDNNLTETFEVDQIRWKQLHVENAHLSVTYDMNGIYGKFGGEAYEGYIEGGFDVYLNDSYTWDGWIAATNVLSTEITQNLTPAYFLLEGKVNGSLIAAGDSKELYQADITCSNATSGRFSIAALNDMLDTLPSEIGASLTDQITRIGLETLRDFDYETVEAKGRFHGREGSGFLKIFGPTGSRQFEVNVLDHRWKVDPPAVTASENPPVTFVPPPDAGR